MLPSFLVFSHPKAFPFQVRRVRNSYTHFISESTKSVYSIQEIECSLYPTIVWDADPILSSILDILLHMTVSRLMLPCAQRLNWERRT